MRARSVTTIDQRSGEAACWARLSYYAGLAPGDGLRFSEGTAVLPLESQPESSAEKRSLRIVEWRRSNASDQASPLEQRLADGWLQARTPTQFVTSRIGKTKAMLEVKAVEAGQSPQIVNQLGARIKQLVLVDENGGCFVGADLAPDASIALTRAASQHEAFGPISALLTASQPEVPPGMAYSSGDRSFFGLGGRYRYQYPYRYGPAYPRQSGGTALPDASQNTSVLERTFRETAEQLKDNKLLRRSYVAVMETSPGVELGTPGAREETSFHLVVGKW